MFTSKVKYLGNLRTEAQHVRSGNTMITDAPVDNRGKGEYFSPTDSLATSLATCMITVMGIKSGDAGFELGDVEANVKKHMQNNPRRVGRIEIELHFANDYSEDERAILEDAAMNCPVALSLHPDIEQEVSFFFKQLEND